MKLATRILFVLELICGVAVLAFGLVALGMSLVRWKAELAVFGLVMALLGWATTRESIRRYHKMMAALDGDPEAGMALEADQRWDCKWIGRLNGPLVCLLSLFMAISFLGAGDLSPWLRMVLCGFPLAILVHSLRWTIRSWRS